MKILCTNVVLAVFICAGFLSCKKDKIEMVSSEFLLKTSFMVQPDSTGFNSVYTLDPGTLNQAAGDDIENIKSLELMDVRYVITYYNGPIEQMISTASLSVSDTAGNDVQVIGTISDMNLALLVNNEQSFAFHQSGAERFIELILNSPNSAKLTFNGFLNGAYPRGFGFVFCAIFKFKQHKDNPT